jgi:hypothetical protein
MPSLPVQGLPQHHTGKIGRMMYNVINETRKSARLHVDSITIEPKGNHLKGMEGKVQSHRYSLQSNWGLETYDA